MLEYILAAYITTFTIILAVFIASYNQYLNKKAKLASKSIVAGKK